MAALGDSHNFGRRVTVRGGLIEKPRTVFWEWLLLGKTSPLRPLLHGIGWKTGLGSEAFGFLPALALTRPRSAQGGRIEPIALRPLTGRFDRLDFARTVGRALALYSWLGLGDLHWENLALGVDAEGRVVFGPLDVELVLSDFALPTETRLLPEADADYGAVYRHAAGIRRALPYLGKPTPGEAVLALVASYIQTLLALEAHAGAVAQLIASLPGHAQAPIRVMLRGTDEYVAARSGPVWPPILPAEAEQLERGDVPYFFRLYGRPGIHYYGNRALSEVRSLPSRGDVPRLGPLLSLARGLRSPSRARLREQGAFALLGAFDHPALEGRFESETLSVTFGKRTLTLALPNGERLSSKRNLSAFVGSVYLPCRCGEVRSVLVPRVTRCAARGAS